MANLPRSAETWWVRNPAGWKASTRVRAWPRRRPRGRACGLARATVAGLSIPALPD